MEGINQKYNLEIEVLTPLSVGAGAEKDWVRGVDFVVDNGKLYKLNLKKMISNGIKIDDLTSYFASKNEEGLKLKLAGMLYECSDFSIPFPIESENDVKTFVKNQFTGDPVLPGSSLKGSIRSVLFQYLEGRTKDGKEVFGSSTEGDEFMRFIKISDAEFDKTAVSLVNTKVFNLRRIGNDWQGGWKFSGSRTDPRYQSTGFNSLYESLTPEEKGYASLMMSVETFHNFDIDGFYKKKKDDLQRQLQKERNPEKQQKIQKNIKDVERLLNTVELKQKAINFDNLFAIINLHTKDYLEKERAFFKQYSTERTDEIVNSIDALLKRIPSDNSYCILKMSAGSGFHSITGDWQFDDYTKAPLDRKRVKEGKVNPKSRKIAEWNDNLSLMGFVKLRVISDDEVLDLEKRRSEALRIKEEERLKAIEEDKRRKEAEEIVIRQQKENEEKYKMLTSEGEILFSDKHYEEALNKFLEAKALIPMRFGLEAIVEELKQHVEAIQQSKSIEIAKQKEIEERKKSYAVPLSDKIANAQKLPTLYGNVKQWMKQNEIESLSEDDKNILFQKIKSIVDVMKEKERLKLKSLGKDLESLVSIDTASQWFQKILK